VLESALEEIENGLDDYPRPSSYYLEDGSFIRLDEVTLGYSIPTEKIGFIQKFRVYFSSNNVFTLTKYTGIDPEVAYDGLSFGLDQYNVYPKTRTFTFGVNMTF
jgi:iron complex outermembrane receptor protein